MKGEKYTPQEEMFCDLVVRTGRYKQAYELAYDCENMKSAAIRIEASRMAAKPRIKKRIEYYRKKAVDKMHVSPEWVVRETKNLYEEAREKGQITQARRLLRDIGETMGIYRDNLMVAGDLSDLSDEELNERIIEALAKITNPDKQRAFLMGLKVVWDSRDASIARRSKPANSRLPSDGAAGRTGAPKQ